MPNLFVWLHHGAVETTFYEVGSTFFEHPLLVSDSPHGLTLLL